MALFIKGQSHWLLIEPVAGGEAGATILRLDKTEYSGVISALESKSGKPVEMLVPSQILDPFSRDEDETVRYRGGRVVAALESAMAQFSCKVGKSRPDRIECTRLFRPADGIGGGEVVTALLESKGEETRVQIKTQKGMGRNWSTPIYREMLRRLQSAN